MKLPTAQAGWWNMPNLSQPNPIANLTLPSAQTTWHGTSNARALILDLEQLPPPTIIRNIHDLEKAAQMSSSQVNLEPVYLSSGPISKLGGAYHTYAATLAVERQSCIL